MKIGIDKDLYPLGDCITNIGTKYLPEITKSHGDELEKIIAMAKKFDSNLSLFYHDSLWAALLTHTIKQQSR